MGHRTAPYRAHDESPDISAQKQTPPAEPKEAPCLVLTPALRVEEETVQALIDDLVSSVDLTNSGSDFAAEEDAHPRPQTEHTVSLTKEAAPEVDAQNARVESFVSDAGCAFGKSLPAVALTDDFIGAVGDLGDELSRLEDTIAEMEAAVADSGLEFEPEHEDGFAAAYRDDLDNYSDEYDSAPWHPGPDQSAEDGRSSIDENAEADKALVTSQDATTAGAQPLPDASDDAPLDVYEALGAPESEEPTGHAAIGPRRLHLADTPHEPRRPEIKRSSYTETSDADDIAAGAAAQSLFEGEGTALVDEEALRALVSEIIRKELQGTLGERITRNVRKLVRREIQRALNSQEFD